MTCMRLLLSVFCAAATLLPALSYAESLMVPVNRSELLTSRVDMAEVIVADPDVADIYVHGKRHISVIGKQLGNTTVKLFDANSNLIRSVDVGVTYDLPAIRKALKEFLPYEQVGVEMVNTRVALTGSISSAQAAATAVEIAEQFLTTVRDTASEQAREGEAEADEGSTIINLMSIVSGQQVMLRIRVGEIQRTALKNLGLNLQAVGGADLAFTLATGGGTAAFDPAVDLISGVGNFQLGGESRGYLSTTYTGSNGRGVSALVEALERDGLFKTLAEPNLVSLSGEQAEFLAGGEFPIPVPGTLGQTTIEYKPFGVSVQFTPYVLSENRIRVQVQPEISELSNNNSITVDNFVVPSLITRRASTTVELAPGESFMIAGLIKDTLRTQIDQLPGISEIPILSALFRSTRYERDETELVLSVTPYIVDPIKSGDVRLPTDDFRPASFMENMFYGALGTLSGGAERISQTPSLEGPIGFMVD